MYLHVCVCMPAIAERLRQAYPALPEPAAAGVGSIPVVYVVPLSHIMGKLQLIPAGDHSTIPRSMHGRKDACYKLGVCYRQGAPG